MSLILNLEDLRSSILNLDSKKKCLLSVLVLISTLSVGLCAGLVIQNVYSLSHPDKGDSLTSLPSVRDGFHSGNIFSNYLDEVKMYVKNVSYTDSLVVVEFRGDLYKMKLESVSMTNLTLGLEKVESDSYYWNSDGVLRLETGESCVYLNISTYRPSNLPSSYPKPGVYVSSTGYRFGLISAYYSSGHLIARKMTGDILNNVS